VASGDHGIRNDTATHSCSPANVNAWRALWAKSNPAHTLWKHLLDATAVSLALPNPLDRLGWSDELVALFAGMPDVGKADPHFQFNVLIMGSGLPDLGFAPPNLSARIDVASRHERRRREHFLRCTPRLTAVDLCGLVSISRPWKARH